MYECVKLKSEKAHSAEKRPQRVVALEKQLQSKISCRICFKTIPTRCGLWRYAMIRKSCFDC